MVSTSNKLSSNAAKSSEHDIDEESGVSSQLLHVSFNSFDCRSHSRSINPSSSCTETLYPVNKTRKKQNKLNKKKL